MVITYKKQKEFKMDNNEFELEYGMTIQEFEDFVANGDWYIDTQADDYMQQIIRDLQKQKQCN